MSRGQEDVDYRVEQAKTVYAALNKAAILLAGAIVDLEKEVEYENTLVLIKASLDTVRCAAKPARNILCRALYENIEEVDGR